jgi:hypothetical protein
MKQPPNNLHLYTLFQLQIPLFLIQADLLRQIIMLIKIMKKTML